MKCLILGPKTITDYNFIVSIIESTPFVSDITSLTLDMQPGVAVCAYRWAYARRLPIIEQKTNWERYGKQAGFLNVGEMAYPCSHAIILDDRKTWYVDFALKYFRGLDPKMTVFHWQTPFVSVAESLSDVRPETLSSHALLLADPPSLLPSSTVATVQPAGHPTSSPTAFATPVSGLQIVLDSLPIRRS